MRRRLLIVFVGLALAPGAGAGGKVGQADDNFSWVQNAEQMWGNIESTYHGRNTVCPDGTPMTEAELKNAKEAELRLHSMVREFLQRYPDDSRKWQAIKYLVETNPDMVESEMIYEGLAESPGVPSDIRQWARFQLISGWLVGKGTAAEEEIAAYCRDYPEDQGNCDSMRLSSAYWMVTFRQHAEKAVPILNDLATRGSGYIPDQARALLEKKKQMETPEALAAVARKKQKEAEEAAAGLERAKSVIGKPFLLKATAIDGRSIDTGNLRGKVLLVDYWATWCGPCLAQLPDLLATYRQYHDRGLEVIGVPNDSVEKVRPFVARREMPWPEFVDAQGTMGDYHVEGLPTLFLVNNQGVIVGNSATWWSQTKSGEERAKMLHDQVEKLLAE